MVWPSWMPQSHFETIELTKEQWAYLLPAAPFGRVYRRQGRYFATVDGEQKADLEARLVGLTW
jgi:hypothetical protein